MIELKGKYTDAVIMSEYLEPESMSQIINMINNEAFTNPVVIMPDVHAGKGSVIGFTMRAGDKIIPNIIGVDIGCFTGDTVIPLIRGDKKSLKELCDIEKFHVYSMDKNNQIVVGEASCKKTRKNAELIEVCISGGSVIKCTPDHKFMLIDGIYKEAKDLNIFDSLMPLYRSYQTKDGYESVYSYKSKAALTHKLVAMYKFGDIKGNKVIHHIDGCWYNNHPDNLEMMSSSMHSKLHRRNKCIFGDENFKIKRLKKLREKGFYSPEFYEKKKETGTTNINNYMINNYEKFLKKIKDNGNRGAKYLKEFNKINNNTVYTCEFCGREIKGKGGYTVHQNSCKNKNHKVLWTRSTTERQDVYCLNVPNYHNFALDAGVFVHNCGIRISKFNKEVNEELLNYIKEKIPMGFNIRETALPNIKEYYYSKEFVELCHRIGADHSYILRSLGTLGGGNHFVEVGKSIYSSDTYITIHSGSRNLGKKICEYWQNVAANRKANRYYKKTITTKDAIEKIKSESKKEDWNRKIINFMYHRRKEIKKMKSDLDYLDGTDATYYLKGMKIAQEYAKYNRELILQEIGGCIKDTSIESVHNYISFMDYIIRKGAIASYINNKILIPLNMRDGILVCWGKSNKEWNYSAPHGAGRVLSRGQAKKVLNMGEFKKDMEGIISDISDSLLDEAPRAYKNSEEIERLIEPTARVTDRIIPLLNIKG